MTIIAAGSVATDHLMVFPGRFTGQLVDGELHRISLSFLVDDLQVRRGGIGANVAVGLGVLGLRPVLVGAVGADFAEYRTWLEEHGVDTSHVHVSDTRHTARFVCTTDADQNQIATFYAGAMSEAREIDLGAIIAARGDVEIVVISPDDPEAMLRHTPGTAGRTGWRSPPTRRSRWPGWTAPTSRSSSTARPTCSPIPTRPTCCGRRRAGPRTRCWRASERASPPAAPTA